MDTTIPFRILTVCTGNICRSPMAEYLLREALEKAAPGKFIVTSAGTHAADGYSSLPVTIDVMREIGIDITRHRSRAITGKILDETDLVLGMTRDHTNAILRILPKGHPVQVALLGSWPQVALTGADEIEDPYGNVREIYYDSRDRIESEVNRIVPILIDRYGNR